MHLWVFGEGGSQAGFSSSDLVDRLGGSTANATGVLMSYPRTHAEPSGMPTTYSQGTILFTSALVSLSVFTRPLGTPDRAPRPTLVLAEGLLESPEVYRSANHEGEGHHYERGKNHKELWSGLLMHGPLLSSRREIVSRLRATLVPCWMKIPACWL